MKNVNLVYYICRFKEIMDGKCKYYDRRAVTRGTGGTVATFKTIGKKIAPITESPTRKN